jgi:glyoxylase-like metal-dependent hydrolase (beta-lactamase superfamily II)
VGGLTSTACDHRGVSHDWAEVGERCWVRRYPEWDVNVGVVAGSDGVLVVDTRGTRQQGESLRDEVRRLVPHPEVAWVVNTHQHFDHTFGNIAFDDVTIVAHENAAVGLDAAAERVWRLCREDDPDDPLNAAVVATPLRHPDATFSSVRTVDLGDRYVELLHPGRGHTDGDILIRVPDIDVVFAGDLVEESGPPVFGEDCFPLEWPATLDVALGVLTPGSRVVPGHGAVVDLAFVQHQSTDIAQVANTIGGLVHAGVPLESAPAQGDWPFEADHLGEAVRRGYAHAAPPAGRLPLLSD